MIKLEGFEEVFSDMAEQAKPVTVEDLEHNARTKAEAHEAQMIEDAHEQIKGAL
jgi:hypothetical protein